MYQIKIYIVRHVCIYCIVYISMIVSPIKYHIYTYIYVFYLCIYLCVYHGLSSYIFIYTVYFGPSYILESMCFLVFTLYTL